MVKNHLDSDFAKIDDLFISYVQNISNFQDENVLLQIREKIIVAFWKALKKASSVTPEMMEYTDVMVKTVNYCIDKCSLKLDFDGFCKYTYFSVIKALKSEVSSELFVEKTGMYITDAEDRKRKAIEKAYQQYQIFNNSDKASFIEYAMKFLGFSKKDLEVYLNVISIKSIFEKDDEGNEYFDISEDKNIFLSKWHESDTDDFEKKLSLIDKAWKNQKEDSKSILSELLTQEILLNFVKNNANSDLKEILTNYDFINKNMTNFFFANSNFELPTQQEIGLKYNLSKSGISIKYSRFLRNLQKK